MVVVIYISCAHKIAYHRNSIYIAVIKFFTVHSEYETWSIIHMKSSFFNKSNVTFCNDIIEINFLFYYAFNHILKSWKNELDIVKHYSDKTVSVQYKVSLCCIKLALSENYKIHHTISLRSSFQSLPLHWLLLNHFGAKWFCVMLY